MIRRMEPAEAGAAAEIWLTANLQAHDFIPAAYWHAHLEPVREALSSAEVYVWEEDGALLGLLGLDGEYVEGLFVREDARRRGIGRKLLDFVKQRRKALRLSVYEKNADALRFYRREGFFPGGIGVDAGTGEAEYTMLWRNAAMKMAVIYHSVTGNTRRMGKIIAAGMEQVQGVEVRTFDIDAVDVDFVKEAKCVVFGSPIYAAHITGQMMQFLLSEAGKLNLAGKLAGAYATAQYVHGGGELGIREMLDHCMVLGALTYSGGGACGNPVIHLGPVGIDNTMDIELFDGNFEAYGQRMAAKAMELFG